MGVRRLRVVGVFAGAALLCGAAGAASADETVETDGFVPVPLQVEIEGVPEAGVLSMTVDDTLVVLEEDGSVAGSYRQFTGELGDVTVSDTRDPDDIDPAVTWYVMGQAADFEGDAAQDDITVDHLGWEPKMIDDGGDDDVSAGSLVETVLDGTPPTPPTPNPYRGLVANELMFWPWPQTSADVVSQESWTASADLFLRVEESTAAGTYTSALTLTLFEDAD